jgi:formylglycine-generating enzyme required for sulfatase activity
VAKVTDFGIAKIRQSGQPGGFSGLGYVPSMGQYATPEYMSPEHAAGGKAVEPRSDLYSLGVVVYEMVAARLPFTGPRWEDYAHHHIHTPAPPLGEKRPDLPGELTALVHHCLAKQPADRPPSAAAIRLELEQIEKRLLHRELAVHPATVDFGGVDVGTAWARSVTITNVGLPDATVSEIALEGDPSFTLVLPPLPLTLAPKAKASLEVRFRAGDRGPAKARIRIVSDALDPAGGVGLAGRGIVIGQTVRRELLVDPLTIDFGRVATGLMQSQSVRITNTGSVAVTVSEIALQGDAAFRVVLPPLPVKVAPGAAISFGVGFRPAAVGPAGAHIRIVGDAPGSPIVDVRGAGIPKKRGPLLKAGAAVLAVSLGLGGWYIFSLHRSKAKLGPETQPSPATGPERPSENPPRAVAGQGTGGVAAEGTDAAERRRQVEMAERQGDSYYQKGDYEGAIAAYRRALELDPGNDELERRIQEVEEAEKAEGQCPRGKRCSGQDIIYLLQHHVPPKRVGVLAREHGIDFHITPDFEAELRQAGATDELLATLWGLAPRLRLNPKDGLKYVWIPPGAFMMGCSTAPEDRECDDDEKPPHQVTITRGFWIGQTPVTVGAYKRFAGATGREMPPAPSFNNGWTHENMPIVSVTWDEAQAYCGWMGGRLPTEAEWEYAARGGTTGARYGPIDEIAWYDGNSGRQTHDVAQKRPNGFGLCDMLGNVWEGVSDWYDQNYYQSSPAHDPHGPASGELRVLRGGSWYGDPRYVRVSGRDGYYPTYRDIKNGFRCGGEVGNP